MKYKTNTAMIESDMQIDTGNKRGYNTDHPSRKGKKKRVITDENENEENRQINYEDLNDEFGNVSVSGKLIAKNK